MAIFANNIDQIWPWPFLGYDVSAILLFTSIVDHSSGSCHFMSGRYWVVVFLGVYSQQVYFVMNEYPHCWMMWSMMDLHCDPGMVQERWCTFALSFLSWQTACSEKGLICIFGGPRYAFFCFQIEIHIKLKGPGMNYRGTPIPFFVWVSPINTH